MAESTFPNIQPGALARTYRTSTAIGNGCAVGFPDASGIVAVVTSGPILGVAAAAADADSDVTVVYFGPAFVKLAGTVTWATTPFVTPTTAGEFVAAAANATSQVRCVPLPANGASGVDNDLIFAVVGVGAFHA
jgi:hypothetical protein